MKLLKRKLKMSTKKTDADKLLELQKLCVTEALGGMYEWISEHMEEIGAANRIEDRVGLLQQAYFAGVQSALEIVMEAYKQINEE